MPQVQVAAMVAGQPLTSTVEEISERPLNARHKTWLREKGKDWFSKTSKVNIFYRWKICNRWILF